MQRDSAPEVDGDRPTIAFDRSELRAEQPGDAAADLLVGWPGPARQLSLRHWLGVGSLGVVIVAAAFALPPLVSSGDQGAGPTLAAASSAALPGVQAPMPPGVDGVTGTSFSSTAPSDAPSTAPSTSASAKQSHSAAPSPSPKHPSATGDPAAFTPITVQAEAPENRLSQGAEPVACAACSGGARVRYMGRLDVHLTIPVAGTRTVTLVYEVEGSRNIDMSVNGGRPMVTSLTGVGWQTPSVTQFSAVLPAGDVDLAFYSTAGPCPDIDAVTVS